jgi:protein-tyrosine phosphatase
MVEPPVIDLHSHVLPGLDDGAADMPDALAICRAVCDDGVRTLAATPHVRVDYPTTADAMARALDEVRAAAVDLDLELLPGGEIDLRELRRPLDELRPFGLGGNLNCLLIEMPYAGWPLDLADRLFHLVAAKVTPVLAHPERNDAVQERPERLADLVRSGCLVQITAASLAGRFGSRTRATAKRLLELELAHLVAGDVHGPSRAGAMSAVAGAIGDRSLAHWLTDDVPAALVAGEPPPPRPKPTGLLRRLVRPGRT